MGEIVKSPSGVHYLYRFSDDILRLVRWSAHSVSEADSEGLIFDLNLSSIFLAGSFLEAALNEQIAMAAHNFSSTTKLTQQFWITLAEMKKDLPVTDKWNIIAAACRGQQWDEGIEPYQSHDTLIALRNALVHFKGQYTADDAPPTKRLKSLITQFKQIEIINFRLWKSIRGFPR